MDVNVRGSLTCSASVIGSLDATCHTGAARVREPQNHTEQVLPPIFWVNMHCYSDLTLQGREWHTADYRFEWTMRVMMFRSHVGRACERVNRQTAGRGEERKAKPREGRPVTYSRSMTESQLRPPPRSSLSLVLSPCVWGCSSALQYGKGQESRG